MRTTIDYGKSRSPQFDAVEDIREWLGEKRYKMIAPEMSKVRERKVFVLYCSLAGIQGFPVKAWYEHFHGQGSWNSTSV